MIFFLRFFKVLILSIVFLAGIYDLKTTEIHDVFPYSIFSISFIYYIFFRKDLLSFSFKEVFIGLIIGYALFYLGAWGEGDALLLAAISFSLPLLYPHLSILFGLYILAFYLVALFVIGAIYSVIYSIIFAFVKKGSKAFKEAFKEFLKAKLFLSLSIFGIFLYIFFLIEDIKYILSYIFFLIIFPFLYVFAKYVEKNVFEWYVDVENLKEGDVLAEDLGIKKFSSKLFVGLSKEDVKEIKNLYIKGALKTTKKGKIKIREGVRYGLSFFFACLVLQFFFSYFYLFFLPLTLHT